MDKAIFFFYQWSGVHYKKLLQHDRKKQVSDMRYMLWYFLHSECSFTVQSIAKNFNRHIDTVFKGLAEFKARLNIYHEISDMYDEFIQVWRNKNSAPPNND
jgi:hypothetical protein